MIDAAYAKAVRLYTSAVLLAELRGVLMRPKFARQLELRRLSSQEVFDGYAALATIVTPAIIRPTVLDDPADDAVLACALAAKADLVVSGDGDLLALKAFQGILIVPPAEALVKIEQAR